MDGDGKVNILLVDDQPGKLLAYEAMLSELGERLITARSGREALEHLLRTEISIVLMDVSMPELDGFELAEIIRQHPRYQKTAIIFVSAVHLSDLDRLKGYASGAVDYVSVPVVPELLRAKVRVFAELYRKTRELEKLTADLEQRVTARTAELQASVARQIELAEQLRDADRRKDEFLALLAHELRNPLAPVRNAVSIMRFKGTEDPQLEWCYHVIDRQASQLTRLVDDLLDVSRITRGKINLRREEVEISAIIRDAVDTSRPIVDAHRHQLHVVLPDLPVLLHGDAARLTQIIANLLNNAAKYQNDGGRIDLHAQRAGNSVEVRIRDYGIGLTDEMRPRLFELFSQGERTLDRSQGGLGIGLSLVKKLVELHGGTVTASSEGPGTGSEFIVRLPCIPELPQARLTPDSMSALGTWPRQQRILVVDDSIDAAESMAILLRNDGHQVSVAHDGVTALEIAAAERPSTVLLDIGLPGLDGYEVCRRVRELGLPDVRIVAMTGYGQERDRQRAKAAGFDTHTVKPVQYDELRRLLAI